VVVVVVVVAVSRRPQLRSCSDVPRKTWNKRFFVFSQRPVRVLLLACVGSCSRVSMFVVASMDARFVHVRGPLVRNR